MKPSRIPAEAERFREKGMPEEKLDFTDPKEAFPPRPKGFRTSRPVPWKEVPGALTDERAQQLLDAALADPRVRGFLGERFVHVDTGEIAPEKGQERGPSSPLRTKLSFYSYSKAVAVEVEMQDSKVLGVVPQPGEQPPETQAEVDLAAKLVRLDPRIGSKIADLGARGILTPSDPGQPGDGHRLLWITFRVPSGRPVYGALVDLTDQKVLTVEAFERGAPR